MTELVRPGTLLERIAERTRGSDRLALVLVLLLHLGAICRFFPPTQVLRQASLHQQDHPVHTHRVYLYRQGLYESGLPWGYDPDVSAGAVMNPGQDLGAKPQQVLGVLLPFLSPGAVVRVFLFVALLASPLWILLACRRLGIPEDHQAWILVTLLALVWLVPGSTRWSWSSGLVSFAAAAYFSVYVLALFLSFLARPTARIYLALCLAAALLFLLHILGPVVIIPPLVAYFLTARRLHWSWRLGLLLVPLIVLVLNAFWVVPYLLAQHIPQPAGFPPPHPPDSGTHLLFDEWSELPAHFATPQKLGLFFASIGLMIYGLLILRRTADRRVTICLSLACAFGIFLWLFGSFVPVAPRMQPVRFKIAAYAFMAIPIGTALATLTKRIRLPASASAAGLALVMTLGAILLNRPAGLELPPPSDPLAEFVLLRTDPQDRLLIQTPDGYRSGGYETKIFPMMLGREVIGCNFPAVYDPPQFLKTMLLGRELHAWSPGELREALTRWGVAWAFTVTPEAQALLADALGEPGETLGRYRAFRVPEAPTRFLAGTGRVSVAVNRLELTNLEAAEGLVVVRYRYHPGWHAEPPLPIYRFPVPEDAAGFIALKDPPASVTLRFDAWRMLRAPWPAPGIPASAESDSFADNGPPLHP